MVVERRERRVHRQVLLCVVQVVLLLAAQVHCVEYAQPPQKGSGEFFNAIAGTYDVLNRIISLGFDRQWRQSAVEALQLPPNARVLDVATGTADVAILVAERYPDASVVGIDPSTKMLEVGRRKLERSRVEPSRVQLQIGSAEDLTANPTRFDGAVVAFGVRNFADRRAGLRAISTALHAGARLVVLELSAERHRRWPLLTKARQAFISCVMPAIGGAISGDRLAYNHLHASLESFPHADEFAQMLRECGFEKVHNVAMPPFGLGPRLFVATRSTTP